MLRVGIDLGGTKTEGVVLDAKGNILHRERRPTPQAQGYAAILVTIRDLVLDLERRAGQSCAVGIGTPGSISSKNGRLKNSNTTCLNGQLLKQDLEKLLARQLRLENDANCFALSEALNGAGRGHDVVFGVILGTGVGGGIVFNGRLHSGAQRIAGEWGHNVLEPSGPPCYCGKRGCVETFLSGPGLAHDYRMNGGDPTHDARAIVQAASIGDAKAEAALLRYLDRFGRALSVVINILDPDAIVLGGGLSNIARLYDDGQEKLALYSFNDELRTLLLPHEHGDSSGVRGAAQLWPAQ